MQQQSPLFEIMYERILWAGSYYKKTRVGDPEEYDLNLVMKLPFKEEDITVIFFSNLKKIKYYINKVRRHMICWKLQV